WPMLNLDPEAPVFVPLCGKSKDMLYLREQGHRIIGVELSNFALDCFSRENHLYLNRVGAPPMPYFEGLGYLLIVGDFFKLDRAKLHGVCAVYDRAALIALPEDLRAQYAEHLKSLLQSGTKIFLITLEYDDTEITGPPFNVDQNNVETLFGDWCQIEKITQGKEEDFRGSTAREHLYVLSVS
ncbi:MAG TPA: thiopurine S-methyltransferase, partial [Hellea balneolensis]|nr:thiopurine S-methyltransferase [Hellea balneolensis]